MNNLLLLLTFGAMLGTSGNFINLVTVFVSIEAITHVHELVPLTLKIKDRSPQRYNKSGIEVEAELESSGRLSYGMIVPPRADGSGGVYRGSARQKKNIIYWFFFAASYGLFFLVSSSCKYHRDVYGDAL